MDTVKRRFQNLHALKLHRTQEFIHPRQRIFLDTLPLLLHCNHPALPGFISSQTPAGIPDFTPGRKALQAAATLSKSFVYKKQALKHYPIQGLYLMGSVGSIAYSKNSDLDIWLCHPSDLEAEALEELQQKTQALEKWAESLGLETHFFFIDTSAFRKGQGSPLSAESCGDTQHHLLLEEFYRTGLYLAGQIPIWWLVPPEQENQYNHYVDHLKRKRFIEDHETIDLGGLESVPPREFLGATLWHFYKAIGAPHKSLLKLLLMEAYSSEFPQPQWLSVSLKQAIYEGCTDLDQLDPYILMYRKVEAYLKKLGDASRLDLARQSLYLKINELMSEDEESRELNERRRVLAALTREWGWDGDQLRNLDQRGRWPVDQVIRQQKTLVQALNLSYHQIKRFARDFSQPEQTESRDIQLLGRKLNATLETRPGKIEILSEAGQTSQAELSLHEIQLADGNPGWALYLGRVQAKPGTSALKKSRNLIELLAWAVANRVGDKTTRMTLVSQASSLTRTELQALLKTLEKFLSELPADDKSLEIYACPASLQYCALFINVAQNAFGERPDGTQLMSNRFDILSYGSQRINLVQSVDLILVSSWREILVQHYHGEQALFDCLCHTFNAARPEAPAPRFQCHSFDSSRARSIALRVSSLIAKLVTVFSDQRSDERSPRYLLRVANGFRIFRRNQGALGFWTLANGAELIQELSRPSPAFSPIVFDPQALDDSPLETLFAHNKAGVIQVFFMAAKKQAEVFILDERGSLFWQRHAWVNPALLLTPYAVFLNSILQRHALGVTQPIEYFRLTRTEPRHYTVISAQFKATSNVHPLTIRIVGEESFGGETAYTIYCNDREFSSMDHGAEVFQTVARHILQTRNSRENYPLYITDIDVPVAKLGVDSIGQLQTCHFLHYKRKIEARLNV